MGPEPSVQNGIGAPTKSVSQDLCSKCQSVSIHTLGLYPRVPSNSKLSVLLQCFLSCQCSHCERRNRISKNSCYFGKHFCYMRLYMASRLPNHFESISEPLIYCISLCFQTIHHCPHKGHDIIKGNKNIVFISVAYVHSTASNYNWHSVSIYGINQ